MPRPLIVSRIFAIALPLQFVPIFAQNNTNTNTTEANSCGLRLNQTLAAPVNTTGDISFQFPDLELSEQWHLSLTLNDTRDASRGYQGYNIDGFVSVPDNTNSSACVYMFGGIDATAGTGDNGCEGVLSKTCLNALTTGVQYSSSRCSTTGITGLTEACGKQISAGGIISTTYPIDFSNQTCTLSSPPGGISIPGDYRTWATFGVGLPSEKPASDASNFTLYDRYVRRPIPWVIAASSGGRSQTQVVCLAPERVRPGSRVPQDKTSDAGRSMHERSVKASALAMAGIWGLVTGLG